MSIDKKYELTSNYLYDENHNKVYQIRALKAFGNIRKGQLGGYIAHERNLSQTGDCWVYENAEVSEDARVVHNAMLRDFSKATGNARIYNNVVLLDNTVVTDNACCAGRVVVQNAILKGNTSVEGDDVIKKSPIYIGIEDLNITITQQYVLLDYSENAKHYSLNEWFKLGSNQLSEICNSTWIKKYRNTLDALIYEHNQK